MFTPLYSQITWKMIPVTMKSSTLSFLPDTLGMYGRMNSFTILTRTARAAPTTDASMRTVESFFSETCDIYNREKNPVINTLAIFKLGRVLLTLTADSSIIVYIMAECNICADKYTSQLRKEVKCPYCAFSACIQCTKRYLTETTKDPHCMNRECNVGWNHDFVIETFTKSWYNGPYQQHRKDVLFSREESRLQETMEYLQFLNDVVEYYDREKYKVNIERVNTCAKIPSLTDQKALCKDLKKKMELENQIVTLSDRNRENFQREKLLDDLLRRALVVVWGTPQREDEQQRIQNVV